MSSLETGSTRVNTPSSHPDSDTEQRLRKIAGQEVPRAAPFTDQVPEDLPIYTPDEPADRGPPDEQPIDQDAIDHAVEVPREILSARVEEIRSQYAKQQEELAAIKQQLTAMTSGSRTWS